MAEAVTNGIPASLYVGPAFSLSPEKAGPKMATVFGSSTAFCATGGAASPLPCVSAFANVIVAG